jgi:hypothetical protein
MSQDSPPNIDPAVDATTQYAEATGSPTRIEYDTLLEDYRTVSAQMIRWLETDERNFELTLIAISAAIAASSIAIGQTVYSLLLALALPFYVLAWAQVRRNLAASHNIFYITKMLVPRLNTIIQHTTSPQHDSGKLPEFVSWEGYMSSVRSRSLSNRVVLSIPLLGKVAVQIGLAIVLIVAFFVSQANDPNYTVTALDIVLVFLNAIAILVSLFVVAIGFKAAYDLATS